jgi:hypothetical protein
MKKALLAALAISILSAVSHAQEVPAADVSVGYSLLFLPKGFTLTLNGGSSAVAFNVNHWLGVVGDLGVYGGSSGIPGLVGETYMAGPRFSYRRWNRLAPFAQGLIGGAHANNTSGGFLGTNNAFGFGGGVGGDLVLDHAGKFALRGQLDFLNFRTGHTSSPDFNTGAFRLSTGVVFRIGRRQ